VVQPANLPETPQRDISRNNAIGGAIGMIVGAVVAIVGHRRRRTTA
jgi:hypothetical protein